jgi:hypothetical protein
LFRSLGKGDLALPQQRVDARHVLAQVIDPGEVLQLAGGELEPEVEELLLAFTITPPLGAR